MFEERTAKEKNIAQIRDAIERQINREMDHVRSTAAWEYVLETYSASEIVEALVEELSYGKYILTPRCTCCRRYL